MHEFFGNGRGRLEMAPGYSKKNYPSVNQDIVVTKFGYLW